MRRLLHISLVRRLKRVRNQPSNAPATRVGTTSQLSWRRKAPLDGLDHRRLYLFWCCAGLSRVKDAARGRCHRDAVAD